ncbi:5-formyltetrahydrofolate cyclo-ligase [Maribacter algarum]|uniref:5-formyltetrahydrofolate cyclo-ligase n=1 Tax=Maribacter algarum (ex Zhang et al. 2020) TaxID=2578118 RepID=A0A5S3PW65_9FLAO|nr:5-formyltetrahydrofolate cyclo-ligase [Maribacter algarum]TMM59239.1 5-formyltetrahydrofolate cyclo-ligase [Maribacter algarum]
MLKKDLRLQYTVLRKEVSPQSLLNSSLAISNKLLELPIWDFEYYHIFLPIISKNEVDTSFILSILQGKDKNIVLPKIRSKDRLQNILLTDSTRLKANSWGVPEPIEGVEVPSHKIDVVFVPLLAFDENGNRVGYGKGFYDNFLNGCKKNVIKVGLSLFPAIAKISDLNENDIPLDYCVTPEKVYSFSST